MCFTVYPFSFKNRNRSGSQRYCGLLSWSCLSNGFLRSYVLFFLGQHRFCHVLVNTIYDSNPRGSFVLKQRWNLNFKAVSIIVSAIFYFQDWTDFLVFLRIHPLTRVFFSFRGIVCSRHRCCICCPSSVSSVKKYCPLSTILKPASERSLDNFWSLDYCSNLRSQSCTRFPCCCLLVWGAAGISIVSK